MTYADAMARMLFASVVLMGCSTSHAPPPDYFQCGPIECPPRHYCVRTNDAIIYDDGGLGIGYSCITIPINCETCPCIKVSADCPSTHKPFETCDETNHVMVTCSGT